MWKVLTSKGMKQFQNQRISSASITPLLSWLQQQKLIKMSKYMLVYDSRAHKLQNTLFHRTFYVFQLFLEVIRETTTVNCKKANKLIFQSIQSSTPRLIVVNIKYCCYTNQAIFHTKQSIIKSTWPSLNISFPF